MKSKNIYCPHHPFHTWITFLETQKWKYLQMGSKNYHCYSELGNFSKGPRQSVSISTAPLSQMSIIGSSSHCAARLDDQLVCACPFPAHLTTWHSPICTFSSSHKSLWKDPRICQALSWLRELHMLIFF